MQAGSFRCGFCRVRRAIGQARQPSQSAAFCMPQVPAQPARDGRLRQLGLQVVSDIVRCPTRNFANVPMERLLLYMLQQRLDSSVCLMPLARM